MECSLSVSTLAVGRDVIEVWGTHVSTFLNNIPHQYRIHITLKFLQAIKFPQLWGNVAKDKVVMYVCRHGYNMLPLFKRV